MSQTTTQSRCFVDAKRRKTPDAGSEVRRRAGFSARSTRLFGIPQNRRFAGYTLIEVLIVASIVVLMLGMALPVFRVITGSRSEAGASNIIASMLGRARTDAIGLDKPIGVAFLYNSATQQSYLAEVEFPDCPAWTTGQQLVVPPMGYYTVLTGGTTAYSINPGPNPITVTSPFSLGANTRLGGPPLEMRPNTELLPLPTGIGVQTIFNCPVNLTTGARLTDGYLSLGVILFDGNGRLTCQNYGISKYSKLSTASNLNANYPVLVSPNIFYGNQLGVPSQFGLVVFQNEAFVAQNFPTVDPAYTTPNGGSQQSAYTNGTPSQKNEEDWLDQNATPLLIDRYTGTLIKAE